MFQPLLPGHALGRRGRLWHLLDVTSWMSPLSRCGERSQRSPRASLPCVAQRLTPPRTCGWAHGAPAASSWPGTTARPRHTATGWCTAPWPGSTTTSSWCRATPAPPPAPPSQVRALPPPPRPPPPLQQAGQWRAQISAETQLPLCWHVFEVGLEFTVCWREGFPWDELFSPVWENSHPGNAPPARICPGGK